MAEARQLRRYRGPSARWAPTQKWRYNRGMHIRRAVTVIVLSAGMLAPSAPPPCPADRPVDDIIAEIHKQQSNKKHRNANPLPDVICIGGWCRGRPRKQTPPTFPEPAPESAPQTKNPGEDESS